MKSCGLPRKPPSPPLIDTLRDMVMIESGSSDAEGLKKMADYTEARLKALGARTERRKSVRGIGADIVIGTFEGSGRKKLMLMAHMDTVYERGVLATQPYRVDGERIYGPGIADDKGGIAVVLHALKILNETGWKDFAKITVLFNRRRGSGLDRLRRPDLRARRSTRLCAVVRADGGAAGSKE